MASKRPTRNWRRFIIGLALYAVVIVLLSLFLDADRFPIYLLVLLALVPMVPAIWGMVGWIDAVRTMDELQLRILSEAGLFALGMTAIASLGYGLLEAYAGFPKLSMFWVWFLIAFSYLIGLARAQVRYR